MEAINRVLADPTYRETMESRGYRVSAETPDELRAQIKEELAINQGLIRAADVKLQ